MRPDLGRYEPLMLIAGASLAGAAAIIVPPLWPLAPIALALLLCLLWYRTARLREALWYGFLFGFVTGGAGVAWFWGAFPLDWLGIHSELVQWEVLGITWALVGISFAIGPMLAAGLIWRFRDNAFAALVAALLWVLAEEGRMWGLATLTLGPGSLWGPHFSAAALGYSLVEQPYLLQLARFGGLPMLSFAVMLGGSVLVLAAHAAVARRMRIPGGIAVAAFALLLLLPLFPLRVAPALSAPLQAAIITTAFPNDKAVEAQASVRALLKEAAEAPEAPDIVLLPEGRGLREAFPGKEERADALPKLFDRKEALVISADPVVDEDHELRTRLSYDSTVRGQLATYDKMFFMPLGEYSPYLALPIFSMLRDADVARFIGGRKSSLVKGFDLPAVSYAGATIGGLLCSEAFSPQLYHELASANHANVLVNLSNPVWFRSSRLLQKKIIQAGKLHAVQNGAYYLQANNMSPSFAIAPDGKLIAEAAWDGAGVLFVTLPATD